jgi:GT2 family glycosyltransferase
MRGEDCMTDASDSRRAASCFIIATRNRHDHLVRAVRSVVGQTILPAELCIVDSSEEPLRRSEIEDLCAAAEIELDYVHPAPRGLTVQRNIGIERTTGDPVFLIDDDVTFASSVHEEILDEYGRWGSELGGVRGEPVYPPNQGGLSILWRKLFGMGGWWAEGSGKVRGGFFAEAVASSAEVRVIEYMNGWFMSYRREVFEHELFDERLAGYAFKEDIDFAYRVTKRGYLLLQTPRAQIAHHKSPVERLSVFDHERMAVANQFYLHRKNMPQSLRYKAALWWALVGTMPLNLGKVVRTRDPGYLTGFLVGAWEQARGRGLIDPAAEKERRARVSSA